MTSHVIKWMKDNPAFCISPLSAYDFRIQANKFKVTTCCNLDVSMTDKDLDFEFLENVKQDMAQNKVSAACWRCTNDEKNLAQSERIKLSLIHI